MTVLVVPDEDALADAPSRGVVELASPLTDAVTAYLETRRVLGARLDVRGPFVLAISIDATVRIIGANEPANVEAVRQAVAQALYRYLDP